MTSSEDFLFRAIQNVLFTITYYYRQFCCQVPAVYVHHEHRDDPDHGDHHQLELPNAEDAPHAALDPRRLPRSSTAGDHDDAAVARLPLVPHAARTLPGHQLLRQPSTGARCQ